nr:odorant receptor 8 [Pachyrhinus yasumatsui]
MDYDNIVYSFKMDYDKMKYLGINMKKDEKVSIRFIVYSFTVQVLFMGLFNTMLLIDWLLNSTSVQGFASSGYIITSCIMGQLKTFCLYKKRQHVTDIIKHFEYNHFKFQNQEEVETGIKEFTFFRKAKISLLGLTVLALLAAIATPFIMKREGELPFPAWYPVDISTPPTFYIAFFHQSVSVAVLALAYFHVDILLCGILTFIGLECNVLCLRVQGIGKIGSSQARHQRIIYAVVHHNNIIKVLKTTDLIFGSIYFWQLFASTMTLCMDLFLVSLADPKSFQFFYLVVYFIAITILLLVPCWFASEMTRKSENIPLAAYNCDWMAASNSFKKELMVFMVRSQRPLKLYAANIFEISVEIFVKIIRSSLSYFAVLNNLNN